MSRNQRLGFLGIAVAIAVAAIVGFSAAGDGGEDAGPAAGMPAPQETAQPQEASPGEEQTPEPTATPRPKPKPPLVTGDGVKALSFEEGQTVRFRVRSPEPEEIHVHGYNVTEPVPAGRTMTVSFKATITGIFEVEFHNAGRPVAELKVQPR